MLFLARAKPWLGASLLVLASAGCKSFHFEAAADDPQVVESIFVIVASDAKLALEDISELVRPAHQKEYQYFAQFLPQDGQTWTLGPNSKGELEPEIDGKLITLTIAKSYVKSLTKSVPDAQIALVARFANDTWDCEKVTLVPKGDAKFLIGPSGLERL